MLTRIVLCAVLVAGLSTVCAQGEPSAVLKDCTGRPDIPWDQQIKGCTTIIESKVSTLADRAAAYRRRAIARLEMTYDRPILETGEDRVLAIADLDISIKLDPNNAAAYYFRGDAWYSAGQWRRAIADFSEAILLNRNFGGYYFARARAFLMIGDHAKAIADYTEMIRIDPNDAEAYLARGNAFAELGNHRGAIADYSEAIRVDPKSADPFARRGIQLVVGGDTDRAIADFTEAIAIEPNNGAHHAHRGFVHFYRGAFAASAKDLNRGVELNLSGQLWTFAPFFRYLARIRAGEEAAAELAGHVALHKDYPAIVDLFLGRGSPETVLNSNSPRVDRCETEFYVGQWHLIRGERDAAQTHLQAVINGKCSTDSPHRLAAVVELDRMGR